MMVISAVSCTLMIIKKKKQIEVDVRGPLIVIWMVVLAITTKQFLQYQI